MKETGAQAAAYGDYLETPAGRLRCEQSWRYLQPALQIAVAAGEQAIDLGCGTGWLTVRLAQMGFRVTALDASPEMLAACLQHADDRNVAGKVSVQRAVLGETALEKFGNAFAVVVCHNVLEFLPEPGLVLQQISNLLLPDQRARCSLLVRNYAGEILKAALKQHDISQAHMLLNATVTEDVLFQSRVHLFRDACFTQELAKVELRIVEKYGVCVIADYLVPESAEEQAALLELDDELGRRSEFQAIARYTQYIAAGRNWINHGD